MMDFASITMANLIHYTYTPQIWASNQSMRAQREQSGNQREAGQKLSERERSSQRVWKIWWSGSRALSGRLQNGSGVASGLNRLLTICSKLLII